MCEKLSSIERSQYDKKIEKAEAWCSEQPSEQINTLTKGNAHLAYRYYQELSGALVFKGSSSKEIEKIKQKANRKMAIGITKSVEKLVNEVEEINKAIENMKRLEEIKL